MESPQSSSRRVQVPDRVIDAMLFASGMARQLDEWATGHVATFLTSRTARRLDGWAADHLGAGIPGTKVYERTLKSHFRAGSWPATLIAAAGTFAASDFLLTVARQGQEVHGQVRYLPVTHHAMVGAAVLAGVSALAVKLAPAIDRARQNRRMRMYRRFLDGGRYNARALAIQQEREYRSRAERGRTEGFTR